MLERSRLCIGPWQPDPAGERATGVRLVRDCDSGETVGLVGSMRPDKQPWWKMWTSPYALEVRETDDRALLMTMRPSRLTKGVWLVRDCDDNDVGRLRGCELLDPWGNPFAERILDASGVWTMQEIDGRAYAKRSTSDDGETITFVDPTITNPFLRMLVLASFLLLRPRE